MKTKYLAVGPDVVTHNSLRNNVRYIQTISKVCSNMPTRIIKSFVPFFTKLSFFMTLKVINLKVFFSEMLKEESVNNTTHLEIVITPNPFDIKPLLPANLVCPPPPCLQTGDGGRWWCFEKRQKLEHLLHFPFLHCHQSHHHMTIEALENVVLKSISKFQEREREKEGPIFIGDMCICRFNGETEVLSIFYVCMAKST